MKIVDLIKYEGDNHTFVHKFEGEDFNTLSQLVVHESQEALLFKGGQALDLFGPGTYTMHTKNIPLLNKIVNIPTGGESPFHCEVYFINKTEQMAINWGLGNVNFLDPTHNNYAFTIGANGEMSLRVSDSRRLITKLIGTETDFSQETAKKYFKAPITTHIKTMLPRVLMDKGVSIFEVEAYLSEFSETLKHKISDEMADYGISLEKFWINDILKPTTDPLYITLNKQRGERVTLVNQGEIDMQRADYDRRVGVIGHTGEIQKRKMDVDATRYEQEQLGYTYQQSRGFDVMEKIAANEGSGSDLRNAAMGLGMGFGVGGAFGDAISSISSNTMLSSLTDPVSPAPSDSDIMGGVPGMINLKDEAPVSPAPPAPAPQADDGMAAFKGKLEKLMLMRDMGALDDGEFAAEKQKLIDELRGV